MTACISVENVPLETEGETVSFTVAKGEACVLITPKDEVNATLTRLLIGLTPASQGSIKLFGSYVSTMTVREVYACRQRIGVVYPSGGLVSNLKVWENLTLPLAYHTPLGEDEIESRGRSVLARLGYTGGLMELPGHLTLFQKKLIGFGRAMLTDPLLMLYESPLQGLNRDERDVILTTARAWHGEKPDRASLYLTSNPVIADLVPDAKVIRLMGNSL